MTSQPDPSAPAGIGSGSGSSTSPPGPPAESREVERGGMILGAILIVLGLVFLADRVLGFDLAQFGWPLFVIVPGVLVFLFSFAAPPREGAGLAAAGGITTAVGLVLAVQNVTDAFETWAYAWALVAPGGNGLGTLLYGLIRGIPGLVRSGARDLGIGLVLFVSFGLFFEGVIGLSGEPFLIGSDVLPVVLIGAGGLLLLWGVLQGRRA